MSRKFELAQHGSDIAQVIVDGVEVLMDLEFEKFVEFSEDGTHVAWGTKDGEFIVWEEAEKSFAQRDVPDMAVMYIVSHGAETERKRWRGTRKVKLCCGTLANEPLTNRRFPGEASTQSTLCSC